MQDYYGEDMPSKGDEKNDAYSKALESLEAFYETKIQTIEKRLSALESKVDTLEPSPDATMMEETTRVESVQQDIIEQDPVYRMPYEEIEDDVPHYAEEETFEDEEETIDMDAPEKNVDFKYHLLKILQERPMTSGELRDHANIELKMVTRYLRELQMEKKVKILKEGHIIRYVPLP